VRATSLLPYRVRLIFYVCSKYLASSNSLPNFSIASLCITQLCEYVFSVGFPLYVPKNDVRQLTSNIHHLTFNIRLTSTAGRNCQILQILNICPFNITGRHVSTSGTRKPSPNLHGLKLYGNDHIQYNEKITGNSSFHYRNIHLRAQFISLTTNDAILLLLVGYRANRHQTGTA